MKELQTLTTYEYFKYDHQITIGIDSDKRKHRYLYDLAVSIIDEQMDEYVSSHLMYIAIADLITEVVVDLLWNHFEMHQEYCDHIKNYEDFNDSSKIRISSTKNKDWL
jgi:hypothetical protein